MSRQRMIHPSFHKDEDLARLGFAARLTFIAMWGIADRRGRLEDRPARIKLEALPYDDVNMDAILSDLAAGGHPFIHRYDIGGRRYIQIRNFERFQNPHQREAESVIPPAVCLPWASTGPAPGQHQTSPAESESVTGVGVGVEDGEQKPARKAKQPEKPDLTPLAKTVIDGYNGTFASKLGHTPGNLKAAVRCLEAGYDVADVLEVFEAVEHGTTETARWCKGANHSFEYLVRPMFVHGKTRELTQGPLDKILNELRAGKSGPPKAKPGFANEVVPTNEELEARRKADALRLLGGEAA